MRVVRKNVTSDRHFSEVDSVSSQLFDRVSGEENLTVVPVSRLNEVADLMDGPFSDVDNMSSEIFDRMSVIQRPDATLSARELAAGRPNSKLLQLGAYLRDNVLSDGPEDAAAAEGENGLPGGWVLVRAEDLDASDETPQPLLRRERVQPDPVVVNDIGYKAAQRRSQLPEGIEPLEGAPLQVVDENMHASIRKLMVEQRRDFSRKALPELEPVHTPQPVPQAPETLFERSRETYEMVELGRIQAVLTRFARSETVLAIVMSVWVTLLLMNFLEPGLSQALATVSLMLLGIYRLMNPVKKRRKLVVVDKRAGLARDPALEDAILCQQ